VQEIEQVRGRRPQPLDAYGRQGPDRSQNLRLGGAAAAGLQHPREGELVVAVLVDVGDPQLGLPQEGMVGALEHLALLGDGSDDSLQRRPLVDHSEGVRLDLPDHLLDPAPDGTEVLDPLFP